MTPFEIMGDLGKHLYTKEEVESQLDIYLLIQYLKCSPVTISLAEYLNHSYQLDIYQMYLLVYYAIPKGVKIRWIKTDKIGKDEDILLIQEHYVCGREVAIDIVSMIDDSSLKAIRRLYQNGVQKGSK